MFSRRQGLLSAGCFALASGLSATFPSVVVSGTSQQPEPTAEVPPYISPEKLDEAQSADTNVNQQSETQTQEFESINFPYRADLPVDWVYQPGLSIDQAPVDLFLGQLSNDYQTAVWIYRAAISESTTVEGYMNEILTKVSFLQQQQSETTGSTVSISEPVGEIFAKIDDPISFLVDYPAGEENGWVVGSYMPKPSRSFYYLSNTGFIKDGFAWQFNLACDGQDPYAEGEEVEKFINMLRSVELL